MAKRKLELSLNGLQATGSASIHGVCSSISPVKKGQKSDYFDAQLSDGTSNVRIVGFRKSQQVKMKQHFENNTPLHLDNCEVKVGKRGEQLEVLLKGSTSINASPKKLVSEPMEEGMQPLPSH